MKKYAVRIENLSKVYKLYPSPTDRLKETFHLSRKKYHHDFYALNDISFDIEKGSTIGIIGQNGAGKSTLLKIITGVLTPSAGNFLVNGKVSSLLELGAGFNPELTGIENVYFNGAMLGFNKQEVDEKLEDILTFADIGEFIHQKVKTYSSGMFVRLAFAVAVQVEPDILIVDEALSVGDMRFQQKCFRRMKAFRENGKTVIFVTHDQGTVANFCDYVYWLKDGRVHAHGLPAEVVKKYISYMAYGMDSAEGGKNAGAESSISERAADSGLLDKENVLDSPSAVEWDSIAGCASFGEGHAEISAIAFVHHHTGEKVVRLQGGEPVVFYMKIRFKETIDNLGIGINVNDHVGNTVFAIPSYVYDYTFPELPKGTIVRCAIQFDFPRIRNGKYSISAAVAEGNQINHVQHHWVHDVNFVDVLNTDLKHNLGTVVIPESRFELRFESE